MEGYWILDVHTPCKSRVSQTAAELSERKKKNVISKCYWGILKQDFIFSLDLFHDIVLSRSSFVSTDKTLATADHRNISYVNDQEGNTV